MKFRKDSDERSCNGSIPSGKWYGPLACMRTAGHKGKHIAAMNLAALADGVCFGCRVPIETPHKPDCWRKP